MSNTNTKSTMSDSIFTRKIKALLNNLGFPPELAKIVISYHYICSFLETVKLPPQLPLQPPLQHPATDSKRRHVWSVFRFTLLNQEILDFAVRFTRYKGKLYLVLLADNTTKTRFIPCKDTTAENLLESLIGVILRRIYHAQAATQTDTKLQRLRHVDTPHEWVDDCDYAECCYPHKVGDINIYDDGDCAKLGCTTICAYCNKVAPFHNHLAYISDYDTSCYNGCISTKYDLRCMLCYGTIKSLCTGYDEGNLEELYSGRKVVVLPNLD